MVIFRGKVQCFCFESKVDVFGHQNDLGLGFTGLEAKRGIQNFVVVRAFCEDVSGVGILASRIHHNLQFTSEPIVKWNPVLKCVGVTQFVQDADACARFKVFRFVPDFESVKFFENGDGEGHFVLLEVGQGCMVKQQHARVQHKNFGLDASLFWG